MVISTEACFEFVCSGFRDKDDGCDLSIPPENEESSSSYKTEAGRLERKPNMESSPPKQNHCEEDKMETLKSKVEALDRALKDLRDL